MAKETLQDILAKALSRAELPMEVAQMPEADIIDGMYILQIHIVYAKCLTRFKQIGLTHRTLSIVLCDVVHMHTVIMHRTRMVHHLILSNACLDMWYARVLYSLLESCCATYASNCCTAVVLRKTFPNRAWSMGESPGDAIFKIGGCGYQQQQWLKDTGYWPPCGKALLVQHIKNLKG